MGLHQNGYRDNVGVFRYAGLTASNGCVPSALAINTALTGSMRNITAGQGITSEKVGVPLGYLAPGAWILPQKPGNMSSHDNARAEISAVAAILGGKALAGSTTLTISTNTPDGQLIAFGTGAVTIQLATNTPLLTAVASRGGTASFTIDTNTPVLGAEASIVGTTTITISIADADILPVDDTSPLRTATASMSFSGTLLPYALGHMTGTTEDLGLTVAGITNSVWNALLSNYDTTGTAGKALATASSGGVDLDLMAAAVWAYVSRTLTAGGSGTAPTVDQIAAAILAAAQVTPIKADLDKILGLPFDGSGSEADPWGPV